MLRFQDVIAGPPNVKFPALAAVDSVSDVLGPGRLHACSNIQFVVHWLPGTTQGDITIEASSDPKFTGTWKPIGSASWSGADKMEPVNFSGSYMAIRCRTITAIDGQGAKITAQGLE